MIKAAISLLDKTYSNMKTKTESKVYNKQELI